MPHTPSRRTGRRRALAAAAGLGLAASSLAMIAAPAHAADPVEVNILGINDFHGRIQANGQEAGAAVLAGAVDQIRAAKPNTVFAAAGDLIGASTFESFIAKDKPTIDALNAAGLDVSAVGNHEFDQGYDDLINRVMDPTDPEGGAAWEYIGANVRMRDTGSPALEETWVKDFGDVEVGFVGAVTEELPSLVSPAGIAEIEVTDIVAAANREADELRAGGVDLVVLLVHEGAPSTDCTTMDDDPTSTFGSIVTGVNENVDAIVSGHTHLAYDCRFPVPEWQGRAVTERPVVSAGQYGMFLNQLTYTVDPDTGVAGLSTSIIDLTPAAPAPAYPADEEVKQIVADAVAEAEVLGAQPLGEIAGPFYRAKLANGTSENRGGESTLGNLVAEVQRWATRSETFGGAQIAFMNPGGLRQDMVGTQDSDPATPLEFPATLTYKQAATVQPFANTLVNMTMTGAQIEQLLEQQWQPEGSSRPFLRLGTSRGFEYTYDPATREVTSMWLHGNRITPEESFSVTANSFLASGGDNFLAFKDATGKRDTGRSDLTAMVDYLAKFAVDGALPVDYRQHAVGATFPAEAPATYGPGDTVSFTLSSLAMAGPGDVLDETVAVKFKGETLGTFPVDNTLGTAVFDDYGTAQVQVTLPQYAGDPDVLNVVGSNTGTHVKIPIDTVEQEKDTARVYVERSPREVVVGDTRVRLDVLVLKTGAPASGEVKVRAGGRTYLKVLHGGETVVRLQPFGRIGEKTVTVTYLGDATTKRAVKTLTFEVTR